MSHKHYDEKWQKTQELLENTLRIEPSQADRREQRELIATLYLKYIQISNELNELIQQMVHVQKRMLLKKLLEATLGRILELKFDLVEADLNDWTHCCDVMKSLKLEPFKCELNVPSYFREDDENLTERRKLMENCMIKLGYFHGDVEKLSLMTEEEAIRLIQTHERARQGRLRAQFIKQMRHKKDKMKSHSTSSSTDDTIRHSAALQIQKCWRGFSARRTVRRNKIQEMILLGMIPNNNKLKNEEIEKDISNMKRRKSLQKQREKEYENAVLQTREKLETEQKNSVFEQLSDQIRGWVHEYKEHTGKIPEFTTGSERSGSRLFLSQHGSESEISKSTQVSSSRESKVGKMREGSASKSRTASGGGDKKDDNGVFIDSKMLTSLFLPELNERCEEYNETWKNDTAASISNIYQEPNKDIILNQEMINLENSLRKTVHDMMRSELQQLQDALDRDRGFKSKKKSSKKVKRSSKKSKKKKEKDLTPDRTPDSLYEELFANGIIKKYPEVYMDNFLGESSFENPSRFDSEEIPANSLGDLRQLIKEYCIVPLLTPRLHQSYPNVKSVLLVGPTGSGKNFLVHAICTEIGATLFDLSPSNIVGKYPGKSGLIMLVHLVTKVSRLFQPSIIFMNDAEKPFVKKIAKSDKTDPKRLKKDLPKLIKNLNAEDRIMLIGISKNPWESEQKLLQTVYNKLIVVPRLDYSSRFSIWNSILAKYPSIGYQFDTSVITKLSDGYTAGTITATVREVLNVKRTIQLLIHPLHLLELITPLSTKNPVYKEEEQAIEMWKLKTPMYKRRQKVIEILRENAEEVAKKASRSKK